VLSGAERAVSRAFNGAYPVEITDYSLRMPGSGVKVAVEIAVMALDGGTPIRTNLTGMAHLVPYSSLPFFTFKTFCYVLVIFKYPQTQIRPQHQINERRFTSYTAAGICSGYRGKKKPSL
jgi:hypothetical protein